MIQCIAVRRRGSVDQCPCRAVVGHSLCGKHVRARKVTVWTEVHKCADISRIQALFRGWILRKRLSMGGPGVLSRKDLANDEDLVTCEETAHPMEYFAFTENGKTWWFEFSTIWLWCQKSLEPTNPYTKVPLSADTRKRLRALWAYRRRHGELTPRESDVFEDRLRGRWNILCQAFEDNGFADIHPNQFMRLGKANYYTAFRFLRADLQVSMRSTDPNFQRFMKWTTRGIQDSQRLTTVQYILQASFILMTMACMPADPYIAIFTILSALHRC